MSAPLLEVIPEAHRETALTALSAAFGTGQVTALDPVMGGASGALTYRAVVAERPYLLRLETRRGPLRNPHQYPCMQIAADAGIAPPVRYVSDEAGVAIIDFLSERPLRDHPGGEIAIVREIGGLAARLQATPVFPVLGDYISILGRMLLYVRGANIFAAGLLDRHVEGFERIRAAYRWDNSALVSSHNDPNYGNLLFDGERLWLIDWETAYRNDRLTDVAILCENFAATPELEAELLKAWLGHEPDRLVLARLLLMKQLTRLYYAGLIFSMLAAAPRPAPIADLKAPTRAQFWAAASAGQMKPNDPSTVEKLGKIYLNSFLDGISQPGFKDAISIAQQG